MDFYFIEKCGRKQGPLKLSELKEQAINADDLIWKSDSDQWKKASEFDELSGSYPINPPLTKREQMVIIAKGKFKNETLKKIILAYIISSLALAFFTSLIARSSWESYDSTTVENGISNNYSGTSSLSINSPTPSITLAQREANSRYSYYNPDIDNEEYAAMNQDFLFRPFHSTIYLTRAERNNFETLLFHLLLSSFVSLLFLFLPLTIMIYIAQVGNAKSS